MNSLIRLTCITLVTCALWSSPVMGDEQQAQTLTETQLQEMYLTHLKEEGYLPRVDGDGDVQFKAEGRTYFIAVDTADQHFFRIVFPQFWSIENLGERQKVLVAADYSNRRCKVSKIATVKDNMWASVEIFVANPEDYKPCFKRCLSALDFGVKTFVTKMRE